MVSTLADLYLHVTSHSAGSAAETASVRKESKFSALPSDYIFQPIALETLGPLNASALNMSALILLSKVGLRLTVLSWDPHETLYQFQHLSIIIQHWSHYGFLLLHWQRSGPLAASDICFWLPVFNPMDLYYLEYKNNNDDDDLLCTAHRMEMRQFAWSRWTKTSTSTAITAKWVSLHVIDRISAALLVVLIIVGWLVCLQCVDTVGWASGRASGL